MPQNEIISTSNNLRSLETEFKSTKQKRSLSGVSAIDAGTKKSHNMFAQINKLEKYYEKKFFFNHLLSH